MSDNRQQVDSKDMKQFTSTYNIKHVTSSLYYPQSNGIAKRPVKTAKLLLEHVTDPYRALVTYRVIPLPCMEEVNPY